MVLFVAAKQCTLITVFGEGSQLKSSERGRAQFLVSNPNWESGSILG
jgi:hypothetical protein